MCPGFNYTLKRNVSGIWKTNVSGVAPKCPDFGHFRFERAAPKWMTVVCLPDVVSLIYLLVVRKFLRLHFSAAIWAF